MELDDRCECGAPRPVPAFDPKRARGMTPMEVRQDYPRLWWTCPNCDAQLICYASFEHYLAGDW